MRRFLSSIGISLLALTLSGWGNVLAAALCPHAGMSRTQLSVKDHSGCSAKADEASGDHAAMQHQTMHGMKMRTETASQNHDSGMVAFSQPMGTCAHCFGRDQSPTTANTRALTLKKIETGAELEQPAGLSASLAIVFTPQFAPTQHAPPGQANRKHLLLSIFLI